MSADGHIFLYLFTATCSQLNVHSKCSRQHVHCKMFTASSNLVCNAIQDHNITKYRIFIYTVGAVTKFPPFCSCENVYFGYQFKAQCRMRPPWYQHCFHHYQRGCQRELQAKNYKTLQTTNTSKTYMRNSGSNVFPSQNHNTWNISDIGSHRLPP